MKTIINLNDWLNKHEKSIGIIALLIIAFMFFFVDKEKWKSIYVISMLPWCLYLLSRKLLGIEYPNKIKVFTPGKDKTTEQKVFLVFYIILAVSAFVMIANKIKFGFIVFIIFIIISFAIGLTGTLIGISKFDLKKSRIKKIIVLADEFVFYTEKKHAFKYKESRWKAKKYNEIIIYNKYDVSKNIIIFLVDYKSVIRESILNEVKSRIEKGIDIIY